MNRKRRIVATLLTGTLILTTIPAAPLVAQERVEVGNAATVIGEVRMSNPQIAKPRKIERKQRLAWGDLVDTAKKSQLQILLLDRSTFGIGASSRVRIDKYVYDPAKGRSVFATMIKGALRFLSGRQGENDAEIQSPSGRIGIRGTALDMLVGETAKKIGDAERAVGKVSGNKDEATLVVLRGPGAATEGGLTVGLAEVTAAGKTVVLDQPGHAAYIPRNGAPPIGPFFISDPGLSKVQDELAPEVTRAAAGGGGLLKALLPIAGAIAIGSILSGNKDEASPTGRVPSNPNNTQTSDVPPRSPNG